LCLWTTRARLLGLLPLAVGAVAAASSPSPDLLVTGDGRHLAVIDGDGTPRLLRDRTGDFIRSIFAEAAGFDGEPAELAARPHSACSKDACVALLRSGGREWRLLATRSPQRIDWIVLTRACADADIAVSDRWLPKGCVPRWLKLDRATLARTGGVAIYLGAEPRVETVAGRVGAHPWRTEPEPRFRSTPRARFRPDRRNGTGGRRGS
jgi:competence protein ComEC